ncbi:DoxX family protein [Nannocystaceae bacterium ST9]
MSSSSPSKGLNIGLWSVQILLGAMFTMVGVWKTFTPIEQLAEGLPWVADAAGLIRFIGVSELAGGLGLILPAALRIQPRLTPLAALGLLVIMILAAGFHAVEGEWASLPVNVVLGGLAAFVLWGRTKAAPIQPR